MRHRLKFRALSRDSAHRQALLRNLVTSVLQHQQIKTTLAKAREAAPLVERVISYGKRGDMIGFKQAQASILDNAVLTKVFGEYANRYANRVGGYTRIHKFGNRHGDNAPMAILELVDNPKDIKVEMIARVVGWEMLEAKLRTATPGEILSQGISSQETNEAIERDLQLGYHTTGGILKGKTRLSLQKATKFSPESLSLIVNKAHEYMRDLIAQPLQISKMIEKSKQAPLDRSQLAREEREGIEAEREASGGISARRRPRFRSNKVQGNEDEKTASDSAKNVDSILRARHAGAASPGEWRGPLKRAQGVLGKPVKSRYGLPTTPIAYTYETTIGRPDNS